jgi:2-aminoadipate transaminase
LGWIVAPPEVISKLAQLKQGADLHTSTFTQFVAYEVARDGFLDKHVKLIRQIYSERRDVMLQALKDSFPPAVTWTHPKGGLFLWVTLPEGLDMKAIFNSALEQDVAFVPGDSFYANVGHNNVGRNNDDCNLGSREGSRHMRLNFSNAAPDEIREGIRRLSIALKSHLPSAVHGLERSAEVSRA